MSLTINHRAYQILASLGIRGWRLEVLDSSGDVLYRRSELPTKQSAITAGTQFLMCLQACGW